MISNKLSLEQVADEFRAAMGSPTLPAAAGLCLAMATHYLLALERRNNLNEVNDAIASLRIAGTMLEALNNVVLDG
jgi:hypothetical protein